MWVRGFYAPFEQCNSVIGFLLSVGCDRSINKKIGAQLRQVGMRVCALSVLVAGNTT